jgi:hypothetical protein
VRSVHVVLSVLFLAAPARAAAIVPFDVQVPLVLKALTYDRNLKARASDQVRIAIIVPPRASRSATDDLLASVARMPGRTVNGLSVVFKELSGDEAALDQALRDGHWSVAYVMPGFSHAELARVRRICELHRVLSVAAAIDDLEHGLAFGIGAEGSRPQIVVNLPVSKACGSDFDLALLQLSKVLR